MSEKNILDVIGKYVELKKRGKRYLGLCPFHHETEPSFFVDPKTQRWACFGCAAFGDVDDFAKKIKGEE